jgi:hypothetical protein
VPDLPFHAFPHGLTRSVVPLSLSLPLPAPEQAWQLIAGFARGEVSPLLDLLEALPAPSSPALEEFWQEERERLESYAAKVAPREQTAAMEARAPAGPVAITLRLI